MDFSVYGARQSVIKSDSKLTNSKSNSKTKVTDLYPHKNMHMNVHSSFIHNYQKLKATKMPFNRWMDKHTVMHPHNGILSGNWKKGAIKPWKDMEEI